MSTMTSLAMTKRRGSTTTQFSCRASPGRKAMSSSIHRGALNRTMRKHALSGFRITWSTRGASIRTAWSLSWAHRERIGCLNCGSCRKAPHHQFRTAKHQASQYWFKRTGTALKSRAGFFYRLSLLGNTHAHFLLHINNKALALWQDGILATLEGPANYCYRRQRKEHRAHDCGSRRHFAAMTDARDPIGASRQLLMRLHWNA